MKLMRKDMGGAAAVCAAVLGAADLALPVRVTALAPLAENMVSGSADAPRRRGPPLRRAHHARSSTPTPRAGWCSATRWPTPRGGCEPDVLVDLATLTGAQHVALGKRTAAIFSDDDGAGRRAAPRPAPRSGEQMWRMPLADDYQALLRSDVADLNNAPPGIEAGAVIAALFLREFTGALRDRWAHIDMSSPSWIETERRAAGQGGDRVGRAHPAALAGHPLSTVTPTGIGRRRLGIAGAGGALAQPFAAQSSPVPVGTRRRRPLWSVADVGHQLARSSTSRRRAALRHRGGMVDHEQAAHAQQPVCGADAGRVVERIAVDEDQVVRAVGQAGQDLRAAPAISRVRDGGVTRPRRRTAGPSPGAPARRRWW